MSINTNNGWLIIDKPYDMGSTTVVSRLKHLLHPPRIGHAGTLDPKATGVLPIAIGQATKLIPFVMDGSKTYEFEVTWGAETETDDAAGAITSTSNIRPQSADIQAVLPTFIGDILQRPPPYSALKVAGKRAYDLARTGTPIDLKERPIHIDELTLISTAPDHAAFRVVCGKGTYVRALGRDMGRHLGCLGHITRLRRIACGPFTLSDAVCLDDVEASPDTVRFLPMETALNKIPAFHCSPAEWDRLRNGQRLPVRDFAEQIGTTPTIVRLMLDDQLKGLAKLQRGVLHPYRIFA